MIVSGSTSWRRSTAPTDPATLIDRVGRLLSTALHIDVPARDTDLFEAGVLDSLGFVELLVQLEREFGLVIATADIEVENFRTVEQIARFIGTAT
jgi:acyl carrier protein